MNYNDLADYIINDLFFQLYHFNGTFEKIKIMDLCEGQTYKFYFHAPNWDKTFEILAYGHWPGDFDFLRPVENSFGSIFSKFSIKLEVNTKLEAGIGIRAFSKKNIIRFENKVYNVFFIH